ncbi:MAG: thiol:disulfide interchange protein DsbA/DsbL [Nevskiaceae bacterium]|jgi:thiol:disulfide interchange protein DsbA|nr:thiol:disulfide interchange protein DsbA/DsbL [Nevskiaceae bacterium]
MTHTIKSLAIAVAAALLLAACGSKPAAEQAAAPVAEAATVDAAPADSSATDAAALTEAARSTQESVSAAADSSDASLQRLAPLPANAQLPSGRWKAGTNYVAVVPAQNTRAEPGQVEVIEVFWLGCAHCYALEPFMQAWRKSKADYIKFEAVPVMWGAAHRSHARLYYTLVALGREDLAAVAFDEIHKRGNYLVANNDAQSEKMQLAWAKTQGISEADFNREYNGFSVNTNMQRAEEITRRYKIEGVPRVVINGKYETDVGMAGGHNELIQLINDLAALEKSR